MELIEHRGYRAETHLVTTGDGYILELHRIPNAKGRPVLLQHGVIEGSSLWVINPTASALPFVLADRGYDVWLGNNRGNVYARKHVRLDPDEAEFWDFSFVSLHFSVTHCVSLCAVRTVGRQLEPNLEAFLNDGNLQKYESR